MSNLIQNGPIHKGLAYCPIRGHEGEAGHYGKRWRAVGPNNGLLPAIRSSKEGGAAQDRTRHLCSITMLLTRRG